SREKSCGGREIRVAGIVLVGRTGSGISATGNTILGRGVFEFEWSGTQACQTEEAQLKGRKIVVVDTPGIFHTDSPGEDIAAEVSKCVKFCSPGPHVILYVMDHLRSSQEETDVIQLIEEIFGLKAKDYTIILFTNKRGLKAQSLENLISSRDKKVKKYIAECGNRCLVFNNNVEGAEREAQVGELMTMIDDLVETNRNLCCSRQRLRHFEDCRTAVREKDRPLPSLGDAGPERRLVLVGKMISGKSATGNTILGSKVFESRWSPFSITEACQKEETQLKGRKVVVVDTPGFFNTYRPDKDIAAEVRRCVKFCSPGPHVILHVMHPFYASHKEIDVVQLIKEIFGLNAKDYTIILFTHQDSQGDRSLEKLISSRNKKVKEYIAECGNRCLAFNNKVEGAEREAQVAELMTMIDALVEMNRCAPWPERRLVLVGKMISGKSATGNTILGSKVFESRWSPFSITEACQKEEAQLKGRKVVVVDTPGFFHTCRPDKDIAAEVRRCVKFCSPGPHVILHVMHPFHASHKEIDVVQLIKEIFGLNAKDYTIILFTHQDSQGDQSLEKLISSRNKKVKEYIAECGNRCLAFNNKAEGVEREAQIVSKTLCKERSTPKNTSLAFNNGSTDTSKCDKLGKHCNV
uniref:AIG1-type G domain-containing protein n=1 Tax=Naja naja TaxID=35670 RepID=A0A8C7E257_NAJNA